MQGMRSIRLRTLEAGPMSLPYAQGVRVPSRRMRRSRVPTTRPKPPTVRLRRLAAELRRLRTGTELSREDVEKRTGINEATLYRIETARARPQRRTLVALP